MSHKEVVYGWYVLFILGILGVFFLFYSTGPTFSPTGHTISLLAYPEVGAEKIWNFAISEDYLYNSSQIVINGTAQLKSTTTTTSTTIVEVNESPLTSALEYEDDDDDVKNRTNKVNSLGSGNVELDDGEAVLAVTLNQQLQDNDTLSLYLLSGTDGGGKIYLCNDSSGCTTGEYGNLTLSESFSAGWYNLTLTGVPSPTDTLFLDSPDKIKMDMVKGYKRTTRTETNTTITYPSSASLQTLDLQPTDLKQWGIFSTVAQLNGQIFSYSYSTNSGSTWVAVPSNGNLSAVSSTGIRFKVELSSNTTETGALDTFNLTYTTQQPCVENWTALYGVCLVNDSRLLSYSDANECGTMTSLPADNRTYINCDYCVPQWAETNSSCRKDNLILGTFTDSNTCYAQTGLAGDNIPPAAKNYTCDYCALHNCSKSLIKTPVAEVRGNKTIFKVDAITNASTLLEIEGTVGNATISIVQYSYNVKNETPSSLPLNRYVDLDANISTISAVKIVLYYTEAELAAAGIAEETISIYYYNETITVWQKLNSTVNNTANSVYAVVPHLSLYGLFGEQNTVASDDSSSIHGGGGGKGVVRSPASATSTESIAVREVTQPVLETKGETTSNPGEVLSETGCNYVIEVTLPDQISLIGSDSFEGEITNNGDCEVPVLSLELSPSLTDRISLNASVLEPLQPGAKGTFLLIRRQQQQADFFSLTSSVISSIKGSETMQGYVNVLARDTQKIVFEQELPLTVTIKDSFPLTSLISVGVMLTLISVLGVLFHRWSIQSKKKFTKKKK